MNEKSLKLIWENKARLATLDELEREIELILTLKDEKSYRDEILYLIRRKKEELK